MARSSTVGAGALVCALVLLGLLISACLLVGVGLAAAFAGIPEGQGSPHAPMWWKFVAFECAFLVAVASIPTAAVASRATRRVFEREEARVSKR